MHRLKIAQKTTLIKEFIYIKILDRRFLRCNIGVIAFKQDGHSRHKEQLPLNQKDYNNIKVCATLHNQGY